MSLFSRREKEVEPSAYEQLASLQSQVRGLQIAIQGAHESAAHVTKAEKRMLELERRVAGLIAQAQDDNARLTNLSSQVQGMKGGRPRSGTAGQAELGAKLMQALQDPNLLQQLIAELQAHQAALAPAAPASPVSMVPRYDPRS